MLREFVPKTTNVGLLGNPTNPHSTLNSPDRLRDMHEAARKFGLELHIVRASEERDFAIAFDTLVERGAGGIVIAGDIFFNTRIEQIARLALRHAMPAIYYMREFAEAGGLMSYGTNFTDIHRQLANYVVKILKGAKPVNLPVEQASKYELVINLTTAKALGIAVPPILRTLANDVIE